MIIKLRKKYKILNLVVKRKQNIKLSVIFNSEKVTTMGKKSPKNIIF